jgi:WD40 repeat protein
MGETVRLWNVRTGATISVLEGHQHWVHSVAFSPDGHTLASGSDEKVGCIFLSDGQTLTSPSYDGSFLFWNIVHRQGL